MGDDPAVRTGRTGPPAAQDTASPGCVDLLQDGERDLGVRPAESPAPAAPVETEAVARDVPDPTGSAGRPAPANRTLSLLLALAGGVAIAVQARITGALRVELGDATLAASVTFGSGLALMLVVNGLVPANRRGVVQMVRGALSGRFPWVFAFSGLLGAFAVYGQAVTVDIVGVALFSLLFIAGQMLSSTVLDTAGWVPSGRHRLGWRRVAGLLLGLGGVALALSPRVAGMLAPDAGAGPGSPLPGGLVLAGPLALVLAAGLLQPPQMAMNGVVGAHVGRVEPLVLFNYLTGTLALLAVAAPQIAAGGFGRLPLGPGDWWYYTGGLLGSVVVIGGAMLTRTIGAMLFTLGLVAGQLAGSLLMDAAWPTRGAEVTWQVLSGAVVTLSALVLASSRSRRTMPGGGAGPDLARGRRRR